MWVTQGLPERWDYGKLYLIIIGKRPLFIPMIGRPINKSFRRHNTALANEKDTNHIERFFCTLRQRTSRLVRLGLSFSKNIVRHVNSIRFIVTHYNLRTTNFLIKYHRKPIETTFSEITNLFLRKIHAVTQKGFLLKVALTLFALTLVESFN